MATKYSVSLQKVVKDNGYEILYTPTSPSDIYISSKDINRPGLILAGYDTYFDPDRFQVLGLNEMGYLMGLESERRQQCLEKFLGTHPTAVLVARNLMPDENFMDTAKKYQVPIVRTKDPTSSSMSTLISYLSVELAERITRHGVLVEVSGEGVLIVGDSGVGKSETAVELIKRGHRLIADDAVEIRKVSNKSVVGQAPDNIRHYVEVRGVGIINARQIFGLGSVKMSEKIDMVIRMEPWDSTKVYDRMGLEENYINIMGINVPATVVPVTPGRNLAVIIETAAISNRQKKMGYNAAQELMQGLGMDDFEPIKQEIEVWDNSPNSEYI
ncbi:MAG: HPr(Ser) kinase/phosphatase [Clostridiales bacterium]|nr:HPr(Ser) kinase/phosphatase [Clostridiales bacterium]MCD7828561.1 HPr(Ser) kinase/phosphatase [Clostridiales bacterium]